MVTAKRRANKKYDAKTYKKVNIALRLADDSDIINSWETAKKSGKTAREWLRDLIDGK